MKQRNNKVLNQSLKTSTEQYPKTAKKLTLGKLVKTIPTTVVILISKNIALGAVNT